MELEGRGDDDEGDVEDFGGHAIANYSDVVCFACHREDVLLIVMLEESWDN